MSRSAQYSSTASFRNSDGWKLNEPERHPRVGVVHLRADARHERQHHQTRSRRSGRAPRAAASDWYGMRAQIHSATAPSTAQIGLAVEHPPRRVALVELADRRRRQHHHQAQHDEDRDDQGDHVEGGGRWLLGLATGVRGRRMTSQRGGPLGRLSSAIADVVERSIEVLIAGLLMRQRGDEPPEVVAASGIPAARVPVEAGTRRRQQHDVARPRQRGRPPRPLRPSRSARSTGRRPANAASISSGRLADRDHRPDAGGLAGERRQVEALVAPAGDQHDRVERADGGERGVGRRGLRVVEPLRCRGRSPSGSMRCGGNSNVGQTGVDVGRARPGRSRGTPQRPRARWTGRAGSARRQRRARWRTAHAAAQRGADPSSCGVDAVVAAVAARR